MSKKEKHGNTKSPLDLTECLFSTVCLTRYEGRNSEKVCVYIQFLHDSPSLIHKLYKSCSLSKFLTLSLFTFSHILLTLFLLTVIITNSWQMFSNCAFLLLRNTQHLFIPTGLSLARAPTLYTCGPTLTLRRRQSPTRQTSCPLPLTLTQLTPWLSASFQTATASLWLSQIALVPLNVLAVPPPASLQPNLLSPLMYLQTHPPPHPLPPYPAQTLPSFRAHRLTL